MNEEAFLFFFSVSLQKPDGLVNIIDKINGTQYEIILCNIHSANTNCPFSYSQFLSYFQYYFTPELTLKSVSHY